MADRLTFLPNERFAPLRGVLHDHLARVAQAITPENFPTLCDPLIRGIFKNALNAVGAHEGSIWIVDDKRENLVNALNTGPQAAQLVGYKQPLGTGIISMVMANEQGFVENKVYQNAIHSKAVDNSLKVVTHAMIAVPFYYLKACRGVISCVQLMPAGAAPGAEPEGFDPDDLIRIQNTASIITDLIDYRLLSTAVAWTQS
jgi:hypothetical protein